MNRAYEIRKTTRRRNHHLRLELFATFRYADLFPRHRERPDDVKIHTAEPEYRRSDVHPRAWFDTRARVGQSHVADVCDSAVGVAHRDSIPSRPVGSHDADPELHPDPSALPRLLAEVNPAIDQRVVQLVLLVSFVKEPQCQNDNSDPDNSRYWYGPQPISGTECKEQRVHRHASKEATDSK